MLLIRHPNKHLWKTGITLHSLYNYAVRHYLHPLSTPANTNSMGRVELVTQYKFTKLKSAHCLYPYSHAAVIFVSLWCYTCDGIVYISHLSVLMLFSNIICVMMSLKHTVLYTLTHTCIQTHTCMHALTCKHMQIQVWTCTTLICYILWWNQ